MRSLYLLLAVALLVLALGITSGIAVVVEGPAELPADGIGAGLIVACGLCSMAALLCGQSRRDSWRQIHR